MNSHKVTLQRPASAFDPAQGVLHAEQFQIAYATNDIARAQALFSEKLGIREWRELGGPTAEGGQIDVRLAWVGPTMYELITCTGPGSELYMDRLPAGDGFKLKHHHLGLLIHDEAEWNALLAEAESKGHKVPRVSLNQHFVTSCFVDVPELGHYLEYLWPAQAGKDFFEGVPGN
jgi:catechol 2,3-dioxygenase-like lactoylglutathione lyase family enzyme